jgi:hypothetical protein
MVWRGENLVFLLSRAAFLHLQILDREARDSGLSHEWLYGWPWKELHASPRLAAIHLIAESRGAGRPIQIPAASIPSDGCLVQMIGGLCFLHEARSNVALVSIRQAVSVSSQAEIVLVKTRPNPHLITNLLNRLAQCKTFPADSACL